MHVVIVGAGEVGSHVARLLVEEGHDLAVVELDDQRARKLDATLDAHVVPGSGVDRDALRRAGIGHADLLIAVTAMDEVNLIACMTARKYGPRGLRLVARVRESRGVAGETALSAEDLGLDALVTPGRALVETISETLRYAGSGGVRELAGGRLILVEMTLGDDSPLVHETLAEVRRDFGGEFLVVAVQGVDGLRIPTGGDRIVPGERAFILTLPDRTMELAILSGKPWHRVERVLVVGGGGTGLALCRDLERWGLPVTVIEYNAERAERIAGLLPRSLVVHGDGSDPEVLTPRIREDAVDAVVVLLRDSDRSMLIGAFAKSQGVRKVVVRCDRPGYVPLASTFGVDAALSPRTAMADAVLRFARRGTVEWGFLLGDREAEILEFVVPQWPAHKDIVGRPLREARMPAGALVGAVIRAGEVRIGTGDTVLHPGDGVVVVCRRSAIAAVEELLS